VLVPKPLQSKRGSTGKAGSSLTVKISSISCLKKQNERNNELLTHAKKARYMKGGRIKTTT
jgi:hypothetical protein